MNSRPKPAEATPAQLCSPPELGKVWDRFRGGETVFCANDKAQLALAVDAAIGAYRFVCTHCGNASPWFESGPTGLRIHPVTSPFSTSLADE